MFSKTKGTMSSLYLLKTVYKCYHCLIKSTQQNINLHQPSDVTAGRVVHSTVTGHWSKSNPWFFYL